MRTRGRQSAAALTVVKPLVVRRPEAPSDLTDEQAHEWRSIVNRLPADWFPRETHPLLAQYCRHAVASRRIAQLISAHEQSEAFNVEEYDRLLKMQEREGRAMSSLATRMRISQHASYDKKRKKPALETTPQPWKEED